MDNGTVSKKGNGSWIVIALCHLARACTYFPAKDGDPKHGHAQTNALINTHDGREVPATLNFWGKYADIACSHLEKGSRIFLVGEMTTYDQDTGVKDLGGKKIIRRLSEVRVNHMQFAGATKKQIAARVQKNWNALMNIGRIPATLPLTDELLESLLKVDASPTLTFNMANAQITGMFGNAKVMVNKQFLGPQNAIATAQTVVAAPAISAQLAQMQSMLDEFKKMGAGNMQVQMVKPAEAIADTPVDAFDGLSVA